MPTTHLALSSDLPTWAKVLAAALVAVSLVMLLVEMRRRERSAVPILLTGVMALAALLIAILRPVRIAARESVVGPRIVVLADASRSMALPSDGPDGDPNDTRQAVRDRALGALSAVARDARLRILGFASGAPFPLIVGPSDEGTGATGGSSAFGSGAASAASAFAKGPPPVERGGAARGTASDLGEAIQSLAHSSEERPAAVIVISDGRLDNPKENSSQKALAAIGESLHVPIHTIATTREAKPDASVRRVATAGAAVAHVPIPLRVDIGCDGGLSCDELTVVARELREDGPPALLASGIAHVKDGVGTLDLTVTLDRAGPRIVEIAVAAPSGDVIPENNRRLVTFNVSRERIRVLHVAGRPTDDVRALRQWLKSDASLDIVAFFILRSNTDDKSVPNDEMALIPFPVEELFKEHLPSFDAIVLQDFNAPEFRVDPYFPDIAQYVRAGGGLIVVGGPDSFVHGGYASPPLSDVLPIKLDASPGATASDTLAFIPSWTELGTLAPLLAPLRAIVGDDLPMMPGTNVLGDLQPGGLALWTHPSRTTRSGAPMPVLAIGDVGDGRSIALGVDGGWMLQFSALGARTAGRGHGALWDGLLGWLMRDPRYEPAQIELVGGCTAGLASAVRIRVLPGALDGHESAAGAGGAGGGPDSGAASSAKRSAASGSPETVTFDVDRLDVRGRAPTIHLEVHRPAGGDTIELPLPALEAGGYAARLRLGRGQTTRRDFACEAGGDEWADSRPDPERLRALSEATGGHFAFAGDDLREIPMPKPTVVSAERHVVPLAPPWAWTVLAAVALGAHWIVRRRSGLA